MISRPDSNTLRAIGARGVSILTSFLLTLTVARFLGASDSGWFFLVMTIVATLATLGRYGSDLIALRVCGGDTDDLRADLTNLLGLCTIASIVAAGLGCAAVLLGILAIPTVPGAVLLLVVTAAIPQAIVVLAGAILRGRGRLGLGVFSELGSMPLVTLTLLVVLEFTDLLTLTTALVSLAIAPWFTVAWSVPAALISVAQQAEDGRSGGVTPRSRQGIALFLRRRFRQATAMMGASLAYFLMTWMPVYVLSLAGTPDAVSYYTVAARLANFISLVPSIQISYLAPTFARLFHSGQLGALNALCARSTRGAALVTLIPAVIFVAAAPLLTRALYGSDFDPAALPLAILAMGAFVAVLLGQVNQLTLLCGLEGWALALNLSALCMWLVLGPWATAAAGAAGVAGVAAVTTVAYAAIASALLLRKRGVRSYVRFRADMHTAPSS